MFDYMVVSLDGRYAYTIGTKSYCLQYIMRKGLRATTKVIYCPDPKAA